MQEPNHESAHNRKQFQIDRIAFFSDAVIAIAITLMVLEIKIPPLGRKSTLLEIFNKYEETFFTHLSALFLCFFTIGNLWMRHHELYEHIINYNKKLIKRNLYFLLTIVVLPITIGFMFDEGSPVQLKLVLFFLNLALCNLSYYTMLVVIFHQKNNFSSLSDQKKINNSKRATLAFLLVFVSALVLALVNVSWVYVPFIVGPFLRLINGIYKWVRGKINSRTTHNHQEKSAHS
jgi:uncharacterized membrane protein